MKLLNQVGIVTGAGQGIGRAIAVRFAEEGADVVIVDLQTDERPQETVRMVEALGRRALAFTADAADMQTVAQVVDDTLDSFGRIDCLVNNAGVALPAPVLEVTDEQWERVVATDLKAHFVCSQAVARHWRSAGRSGKIVSIGSIHGTRSYKTFTHYAAAKSGLKGLIRTMALELAEYNINANLVSPGVIDTGTHIRPPNIEELVENEIPLKRMGRCEEVASLVLFLVSNESDYITGAEIVIDGGYLLYPFTI